MTTVCTAYGPGEVVDRDKVHGRTRYKVAGPGFSVWMDSTDLCHEAATTIEPAAQVNENNRTRCPTTRPRSSRRPCGRTR